MNNAPLSSQGEMAAQVKVICKENRPPLDYSLFSYNFNDEDMYINENYLNSIHNLNCAEVYHTSHLSQSGEEVKAVIKEQIVDSKRNAREADLESAQDPSTLKNTTLITSRIQVS